MYRDEVCVLIGLWTACRISLFISCFVLFPQAPNDKHQLGQKQITDIVECLENTPLIQPDAVSSWLAAPSQHTVSPAYSQVQLEHLWNSFFNSIPLCAAFEEFVRLHPRWTTPAGGCVLPTSLRQPCPVCLLLPETWSSQQSCALHPG